MIIIIVTALHAAGLDGDTNVLRSLYPRTDIYRGEIFTISPPTNYRTRISPESYFANSVSDKSIVGVAFYDISF